MAYLNHDSNTVVVDAVITKKGRELLSQGEGKFNIVKFAVADDEVDYDLWNPDNAKGTNYYGETIENMPLMEANPNEIMNLRYKLISLNKDQTRVSVLTSLPSSLVLESGANYTLTPQTNPSSIDKSLGYTCVVHDSSIFTLTVLQAAPNATTPSYYQSIVDKATSLVATGLSFQVHAKPQATDQTTKVTFIGNESGATWTVDFTVNALATLADGSINTQNI